MKSNSLQELATMPVGRLLWKYSVPAVVGQLVMSTYNIIDRVFIGQVVGADAIAGLAVTFPLMNIGTALGTLIGVGASALISLALGKSDFDKAERIFGNSFVMTLAIAFSYTAVFFLFLEPILRMFGASDVTLPYAYDYMLYMLPGLVLTNLCFSFNNIMRASGFPKKAMVTMLIGAGVNIALDPLFIFVLDMGIRGAAIATVIAMFVSSAFVMAHFSSKSRTLRFKHGIYNLDWRLITSIMALGASPFLINMAGCCISVLLNTTLYRYGGDIAIGAAGIFVTYTQMVVILAIGISQGLQPIIGYNYGAHNYDRMRRVFFLAAAISSGIFIVGTLVAQIFPYYISAMFTTDAGLIAASEHALHLVTLSFWLAGFPIISTTLFQSIGAAGKSIFLSLTRQVIFIIPALLFMPYLLGLDGVWLSFVVADLCAFSVTVVMVSREFSRIRKMQEA